MEAPSHFLVVSERQFSGTHLQSQETQVSWNLNTEDLLPHHTIMCGVEDDNMEDDIFERRRERETKHCIGVPF